MKQLKLLAGAVWLAAIAMPESAMAAPAPMGSEAVVVTPLSFVEVNDLSFGTIVPSNTAGNVILNPNGTRTATNGIILVGSNQKPGEFAGMGTFNQIVDIAVGSNTIFIYGPGTRMRVRSWTVGSTPTTLLTTTPRFFRIGSPTGIFRFPVGAELRVGANQTPGKYTGTWTITLNYN